MYYLFSTGNYVVIIRLTLLDRDDGDNDRDGDLDEDGADDHGPENDTEDKCDDSQSRSLPPLQAYTVSAHADRASEPGQWETSLPLPARDACHESPTYL